jgi:hypothetical protein
VPTGERPDPHRSDPSRVVAWSRHGIWCRPKKTRRRRKSVFIPLRTADALELDRWTKTPITFFNTRRKSPWKVHNADLYLYSPRGKPYTETSLRARWHRWLASKDGLALCKKWAEWLTAQVAKYEWEIDPLDVKGPTIHGLRGTGCSPGGRTATTPTRSRTTSACRGRWWNHYMRFGDQMEVAAEGRKRLRLVGSTTDRDDRI